VANLNKSECECMGFYDGAGGCLPYDPEIHTSEPCPSGFFGGIANYLSGITQEQWIGGTAFGIQMCKLFGGCGGIGAGSYSDPNSPAYLMYIREQRKKTNTIIILSLVIIGLVIWSVNKLGK
jgi:hypothetical protein